jgi:hypothetical protein
MQIYQSQTVDTPAAVDFMSEILGRLDRYDLSDMTEQLARKSEWMGLALTSDRLSSLDSEGWYRLLRGFFPARRKARAMVEVLGPSKLVGSFEDLLYGSGDLSSRVERFEDRLVDFEEVTVDLTWELLHLVYPSRYWLWTRWMWNPRTETGSLRLVTVEDVELQGLDRIDTYERVGRALAVVQETARAMGYVDDGPFGIDVFLACVYGVYMYTVLRMRMSQEFTRIVPELPSLARRLLGIHHWEVERCP